MQAKFYSGKVFMQFPRFQTLMTRIAVLSFSRRRLLTTNTDELGGFLQTLHIADKT